MPATPYDSETDLLKKILAKVSGSGTSFEVAARTKAGTYYAADYGTISDTLAVSHLAIQSAIDAAFAAGGGTVMLPPQLILLGASIVPRNGITIRGTLPNSEIVLGAVWDSKFNLVSGTRLSYPGGTVWVQDTSASFAEHEPLVAFNLLDHGYKNIESVMNCGAQSKHGWTGSQCRNIFVEGATGTAFDMTNPFHLRFDHVKLSQVRRGLKMVGNYRSAEVGMQPGNCVFSDVFVILDDQAQANYGLEISCATGNEYNINYIEFHRFQCNRFFTTPGATKSGSHIRLVGNATSVVDGITFSGLDLEGYADFCIYANRALNVRAEVTTCHGPTYTNGTIDCVDTLDWIVHSLHANTKLRFNGATAAGRTYAFGVYKNTGDSTNGFALGMYIVADDSYKQWYQFAPYNGANLKGSTYNLDFTGRINLQAGGGINVGTWDYNDTGGTLWGAYSSGTINLNGTGAQTKALAAAASYPGETLVIRHASASGTKTITGARGGDVTLLNQWSSVTLRSIKDPGASTYQWEVIARNGT